MSFPLTPAFITESAGWDKVRAHPAMQWMEKYTLAFDADQLASSSFSDWHTDDLTYQKGTGEVITGGETAFKACLEVYAPFAAHLHEPAFVIVWETEDGYEMVGQATLFADLKVPGGEKKMADLTGRKWDIGIPGMFRFSYMKVEGAPHDGLKMRRNEVFSDSGPAIVEMLKRGMVKPEQLLG